ncbi:hypothetical protein CCMSSC00406_0000043 [Pleurotus cornucopiae]|uniref:Uncharacterized protein n=1 Tax=Pleurotus cornucopiae TaxID=5321 RepID=A0ACB7IYD2_PLECO|nr:hypothetical protein CCMSSC00406_0000043 [Pleurotus cornucopiae]
MLKDLSLSPQRTVVFQQDNLPFGEHGLTIVNGHMGSKYKQVMVFLDSIVYTADDSQNDKGSRGKDKADRPRKGSNADGDNFASTQATSENKKLVIIAAICGSEEDETASSYTLARYVELGPRRILAATNICSFMAPKPVRTPISQCPSVTQGSVGYLE